MDTKQVQYIEEDEIDLRELFKTIVKRKYLIIFITLISTLLTGVYVFTIKPTYEVKAVIKIAHIENNPIEASEVIIERIKAVYVNNISDDETTIVSNVSNGKKAQDFLSLATQGLSNKEAEAKLNEVISFIQDNSKATIKQYITKNNNEIKRIEREIKQKEDSLLAKIDNKIALLKKQDIKKIDDKIALFKKQYINSIESKITISEKSVKEYTNSIKNIQDNLEEKNKDISFSAMLVMQLTSYQNMLFNLQTNITDLNLQKDKILNEDIPNLERNKEKILSEDIPNLERNKEKINQVSIKNLEQQKENITFIDIPNLKDQIATLIYNQTKNNIDNAKVIGKISISNYPIKPKKKLIVVVAFITGLILSIFLVFFMEFISKNKEDA